MTVLPFPDVSHGLQTIIAHFWSSVDPAGLENVVNPLIGRTIRAASTASVASAFHEAVPSGSVAEETSNQEIVPEYDKDVMALAGGEVKVDLLNNNNSQYYGDFTLGNPGQKFTAVFDTGSSITWVPGAKCKDTVCSEHHTFAAPRSRTFVGHDAHNGTIRYGTGDIKYETGEDTISFCDSHSNVGCQLNRLGGNGSTEEGIVSLPRHTFGTSIVQSDYPFRMLPFDGIMGLAPSISKGSVLHQMKASNALKHNVLGIYLSEDAHRNGSADFGGVEPMYIAKNSLLNWHKISNPKEWGLDMKDILVDGKPMNLCQDRPGGVCPTVVDTGSSLVTGPESEISQLLQKIRTNEDCGNMASMPKISIEFVNTEGETISYPLTPEEYTLKSLEEEPNSGNAAFFQEFPVLGKGSSPKVTPHCEPGIGIMDTPGDKWVIGDTFLRRYYSIYDDDHGRIGLVRSVHADETPVNEPASGPGRETSRTAQASIGAASVTVCTLARHKVFRRSTQHTGQNRSRGRRFRLTACGNTFL